MQINIAEFGTAHSKKFLIGKAFPLLGTFVLFYVTVDTSPRLILHVP